jgi:translation initiation factor IF-2
VSKVGTIAGCYVVEGVISRQCDGVRVIRDNALVYTGKFHSLKRFKDDVREVQTGYECGIGIENFNDIKVGDVIEVYVIDKVAGKL